MNAYETALHWYRAGKWSKRDLQRLVDKGKLTQEQFDSIIEAVDDGK